ERVAGTARAEPRADLALQHRQRLRGVLVPGVGRRCRGDGGVRLTGRRAFDAPHLVHAGTDAVSPVEDGRAAARRVAVRTALSGRFVREPVDTGAARVRGEARARA